MSSINNTALERTGMFSFVTRRFAGPIWVSPRIKNVKVAFFVNVETLFFYSGRRPQDPIWMFPWNFPGLVVWVTSGTRSTTIQLKKFASSLTISTNFLLSWTNNSVWPTNVFKVQNISYESRRNPNSTSQFKLNRRSIDSFWCELRVGYCFLAASCSLLSAPT